MLVGYMRVSKADGNQTLDLQPGAPLAAGTERDRLHRDHASDRSAVRSGLEACQKAVREGDTLVTWKSDRLGRELRHLVNPVRDLTGRGIGLKVLAGQGACPDTTTANGRLVFGRFVALAGFERGSIIERTRVGLASARARGRKGWRPLKIKVAKVRLAQAAVGTAETKVGDPRTELGVSRQTLHRRVDPGGSLRSDGEKLPGARARQSRPATRRAAPVPA